MEKEIKHHSVHHAHKHKKKINIWQIATYVLGAILLLIAILNLFSPKLTADQAADKAIDFINENLLQPGVEATLVDVKDTGSLYNVKINIADREYDTYITKDGKMLFPTAIPLEDLGDVTGSAVQNTQEIAKSDKPVVELFVMSHCPYGTQIEKGIIPVVNTLKDKIDFKVKFVYYAMHGKTEVDEQLRQYCIQEEQNSKYLDYLTCFLKDGNSESCLATVDVDKAKLDSCIAETDSEYGITQSFNDKSTWLSGQFPPFDIYKEENIKYGVQGSPTLVINGVQVSSARDSASLLSTICSAFNTMPNECSTQLSSETPSPGFGFETTGAATTASCG